MNKIWILLLIFPIFSSAQDDKRAQILKPINLFIEGTSYNYPEKILESFLPGGLMFLHNLPDTLMMWPVERYAALYDNGRRGQQNQRFSELISLDIVEDVAYAKLQVDIPSFSMRFFDLLLLKEIDGEWKIVSKVTDAIPLPMTPQEAKPKPTKELVLDGLKKPWSLAFISENDAIIAEKDGGLVRTDLKSGEKIYIKGMPVDIAGPVLIDTSGHPFGTFPSDANGTSQRYNAGLFQILLDPEFSENKRLYLSYAAENNKKASALKVISAELVNNELINIKTLFLAGPYTHGLFHYGGGMVIGNDGKLYITSGERNLFEHNNPEMPLSQDVKDPRGKVIRINLDGSIPDDNPSFGPGAIEGLYALGIRAAQGLIVHPRTGEIWFSEHGTIQGDEVNKLEAGANYGWPYKTSGRYRSRGFDPKYDETMIFTDPIHYWTHTVRL